MRASYYLMAGLVALAIGGLYFASALRIHNLDDAIRTINQLTAEVTQ